MKEFKETCNHIRQNMMNGNWIAATTKYLSCPIHTRSMVFSSVAALLNRNRRISQYWREIGCVLMSARQATPDKEGKPLLPRDAYELVNSLKHYSESARDDSKR